jgi:hypothetical protein
MSEMDITALVMWSGITAVLMIITGSVYKIYLRKKKHLK